jgi:putative colanic acid biosynthesis UDP-glucose lipid carrier transferase
MYYEEMQTSYFKFIFRIVLFFADLVTINLTFWLIFLFLDESRALSQQLYSQYLLVLNLIWLFTSNFFRMYGEENTQRSELIYRTTWRSIVAHAILFLFYLIITKDTQFSRLFLLTLYSTLCLGFLLTRFIGTILELKLKLLSPRKPVAVLGKNKTGKQLAVYLRNPRNDFSFEGFLNEENNLYADEQGQILPEIIKAIEEAAKKGITEIYVPLTIEQIVDAKYLLREAEKQCVRLKFVPVFMERSVHVQLKVNYMGEFPIMSLRNEPLEDTDNRLQKRFFDLLLSGFVILFVLSWLCPLLGLIIKLQSRGPVMFKQLRSGRDNETFVCYKFRTMAVNKESDTLQATQNDERITAVGRILRKTSLDEMPQFLNVFKGDMSVVGPRPHMLKHTEEYSAAIDMYMVRHFVKPGITGWAQMNGFRGETTNRSQMLNRVKHDIWYLENWSLMLDIKIIFLTIMNVFKGDKNAY